VSGARNSFQLFSIGSSVEGSPTLIDPASFLALRAKEVQDIERWLKQAPTVMGEDLKIVASQFSGFDKTRDRPDLLALDRAGKLVVVEIKRDDSGTGQDLQALRYAAYVSTFTADQVIGLYRAYESEEHDRNLTAAEARKELEDFVATESLDDLDEDEQPRIVLVAGRFQVGVTNTALWMTRNFGLDITCVQLTPYQLNGEIVLASSILIPLPEAADFEVRLQEKRRKATVRRQGDTIDFDIVRAYIGSIPKGRWASYGDVAAAAGAPKGGQALGTWLSRNEKDVPPLVYRVLNRHGEVSSGWKAAESWLPPTPEAVQTKLADEGVTFDANGRASQDQRWTTDDWASLQAETEASSTGDAMAPSPPPA
jgi:alkylated DNA nucleotide flippase Atl1